MRLDTVIEELSAQQHACIATWQLRDLGATSTEISRVRRSVRWELLAPTVLRLVGSPRSGAQAAMAAALEGGPRARISHESSAHLWELGSSYRLERLQVMAPRGSGKALALARFHPLIGIPDRWFTVLDGIPIVRPELCVYQLCGSVNPWRAERALDTAWSKGLLSGKSLRACLDDLAGHGRNGTVVLRMLLKDRPIGYVPPTTGIEARFNEIMSGAGLGTWRRQIDSGGEQWAGRVDFRHDTLPVITEVQSERHHAALSSQRDDEERRGRLKAAGFVVVEVWDIQVWHRRVEVIAAVREGINQAITRAA